MIKENSVSLFSSWQFKEAEPLDLNQSLKIRDGLCLETHILPGPVIQFIHANSRKYNQGYISNN